MSKLDKLVEELEKTEGYDFEKAVTNAFNFLGFESEWTGKEEASPDVVVKAPLATKPFVSIIECCAVSGRGKVKHGKVNQMRDYYPTYQADYGKDWENVYAVLIGRPSFSKPCRKHASKGSKIRLITADILISILYEYDVFQLTNDELESVFSLDPIKSIELNKFDLNRLFNDQRRKLKLYVLIFAALSANPLTGDYDPKPEWISLNELFGIVKTFGLIAYKTQLTNHEIFEATRDLSNPFIKAIEIGRRGEDYFIRRCSIFRTKIFENMGRLKDPFVDELIELGKRLERSSTS